MPYLNLDLNYFDHIKTKRLVGLLGRGSEVLPIRLWCACGKHRAESGKLDGYSAQEIESLVEWWGESGPGARPAHPDWIRSVRDQCVAAVVPFFFKQWGEWLPEDQMPEDHPGMFQDYQETGPNVRLVEYERGPAVAFPSIPMFRVGKKAAGRVLDGRQWHEFPKC